MAASHRAAGLLRYPWNRRNHPSVICKEGLTVGFTRFYSAPLTSTAIADLCLGKLHQVGLPEHVKMFMLVVSSLSVFVQTDCSTRHGIKGQHRPDSIPKPSNLF